MPRNFSGIHPDNFTFLRGIIPMLLMIKGSMDFFLQWIIKFHFRMTNQLVINPDCAHMKFSTTYRRDANSSVAEKILLVNSSAPARLQWSPSRHSQSRQSMKSLEISKATASI